MLNRQGLLALLPSLPLTEVDKRADRVADISGRVIRCVFEGQRAVVVGTDTKTQIGALLDLVELHLQGGNTYGGQRTRTDEVTVLFLEDPGRPEAEDALRTLAASVVDGPAVSLRAISADGALRHVESSACTWEDAATYPRWLALLTKAEKGPGHLLREVVAQAQLSELRAYPMLSQASRWSLRLEGLGVGCFTTHAGSLDVGAPGKQDGLSRQRKAWQTIAGPNPVPVTATPESIARGADVLQRFAKAWLPALATDGKAEAKQDEHALESRILRGFVEIAPAGCTPLTRLRTAPDLNLGADPIVNWGSQFPTRWGRSNAAARYLDALLRDGSTPWAVEIKVEPSASVHQYYRHAVGQTVLYRQFISTAAPLAPWFEMHGLDHNACRGAVVLPELNETQRRMESRLAAVCRAFGVDLVWVPRRHAGLRDT